MKINFKRGKKYFISGFLVIFLVVGGVFVRNKEIEIKFDENGRIIVADKKWYEGQVQFAKKLVDLQERLEEMQKLDDFGGATPEETFNAFVVALKEGDTVLASRYFVFNKQKQMAEELAIGKERGNLEDLIKILEKKENGDFYTGRDDKYEFVVIGDSGKWDGVVEFSFDLEYNEYTKVWKIKSL